MLIAFVVLVESPCVVGPEWEQICISVWPPTHVVDLYVNHRILYLGFCGPVYG